MNRHKFFNEKSKKNIFFEYTFDYRKDPYKGIIEENKRSTLNTLNEIEKSSSLALTEIAKQSEKTLKGIEKSTSQFILELEGKTNETNSTVIKSSNESAAQALKYFCWSVIFVLISLVVSLITSWGSLKKFYKKKMTKWFRELKRYFSKRISRYKHIMGLGSIDPEKE